MTRTYASRWTPSIGVVTARTTAVVAAIVMVAVSGCGLQRVELPRAGSTVFSVGDCVEIPAQAPAADQAPLRAQRVTCSVDPSYTVGAIAEPSGACPSIEYQHLPAEFADSATSRLCLVPNLVADHCYVLDIPIGVVQRADCTERDRNGLLVQVTQRLDVRDQQACASDVGQYAWPYPSPPRTYCTLTVF